MACLFDDQETSESPMNTQNLEVDRRVSGHRPSRHLYMPPGHEKRSRVDAHRGV
jgi:hypothetical protein